MVPKLGKARECWKLAIAETVFSALANLDSLAYNSAVQESFCVTTPGIGLYKCPWAACICQNFEVVRCQKSGSCHMSEWTFVELSLVRMDFCRTVTCQNGLLQNCHMSEWTFAELSLVRMDFCKISTCQNGVLQNIV